MSFRWASFAAALLTLATAIISGSSSALYAQSDSSSAEVYAYGHRLTAPYTFRRIGTAALLINEYQVFPLLPRAMPGVDDSSYGRTVTDALRTKHETMSGLDHLADSLASKAATLDQAVQSVIEVYQASPSVEHVFVEGSNLFVQYAHDEQPTHVVLSSLRRIASTSECPRIGDSPNLDPTSFLSRKEQLLKSQIEGGYVIAFGCGYDLRIPPREASFQQAIDELTSNPTLGVEDVRPVGYEGIFVTYFLEELKFVLEER